MTATKISIKCRKCDKEIYFSSFQYNAKACNRKKCWIRTQKARNEAALLKGCNADDFLFPLTGKIVIVEETKVVNENRYAEGKIMRDGKWVYPVDYYGD